MATEENTIDYSTYGKDQLLEAIGQAYADKDMKLMGQLSKLYTKAEASEAKAAKEELLAELVEITQVVRKAIETVIVKLVEAGKIPEGAEGVWYAQDFGAIEEKGINPACKLVKSGRKASDGSTGKSSYVANPTKSADLLAQVGENVMFADDTEVTIDKQAQVMSAGTTFKEAYDFSTNGGWRNRVRMALLKEAGII